MIFFVFFIFGAYSILILFLSKGFEQLESPNPEMREPETQFSILVPFRNEASNLPALLSSFAALDYPKKKGAGLPRVMILDEVEGKVKKGEVVNLDEKDSETSLKRGNVLGSFHPDKYGINPADYLL